MTSHELLHIVFQPLGCKKIAQALRLSHSLINKWQEPSGKPNSGELNPLDRLVALHQLTGDRRLLDYVCEQAGGRFVPAAELPPLVRRWWTQLKAEMDALIKAGQTKQKLADGSRQKLTGGCRHRLPGGRCGFPSRNR